MDKVDADRIVADEPHGLKVSVDRPALNNRYSTEQYFGLAYVLTDSLALPVGIHFSTNLWTTVVFGQPESGYPAAFRLTRPFDLSADLIIVLLLPTAVLVAAVVLWVRATRGEIPEASLQRVRKH